MGNSQGHRTASNALWNLLPFGWGFLLNLVAVRLVVARLGIEDYGLYGILAVFATPLTLANLGFGEATVKFVAEAAHRGDHEEAGRFLRTTLTLNLGVGALGGLLLALAGPSIVLSVFHLPLTRGPEIAGALRWLALGWVANQSGAAFLAIPPAFQRFRLVALGHFVAQTAVALLGVLGALWGGLEGFAAGTAAGNLCAALAWIVLARGLLPGIAMAPSIDREAWGRAFRFGGWQALAQLGTLLANQVERFLLGIFLTPAAVGLYNVAQGLEQKIYSAVYKMSEVLFPLFSTLQSETPERRVGLLLRASWLLTALAVTLLAPLLPLAAPLLTTWIGDSAVGAVPVLQALALAGILGCASNASFFFLLGSGETRGMAFLAGVTGLVTVVAALLLLPRYGLAVAGLSQAIAMVAQQAILTIRLLPGVLGRRLAVGPALAAMYSPVLGGLLVAFAAASLGATHLRGWTALAGAYLGLAAASALVIAGVGAMLPGADERRRDLRTVLGLAGVMR